MAARNDIKLQEFISQMLKEIIGGIKDAQKDAASNDALINPPSRMIGDLKINQITNGMVVAKGGQVLRDVEFDVAVTNTKRTAKGGGGGISVAWIRVDAEGQSEASSSSVSRIKFSIPLAFPVQTQKG